MFLNHNIQALPEHPSIAGFFRVCDPNLLQRSHCFRAANRLCGPDAPFRVWGSGFRIEGLGFGGVRDHAAKARIVFNKPQKEILTL